MTLRVVLISSRMSISHKQKNNRRYILRFLTNTDVVFTSLLCCFFVPKVDTYKSIMKSYLYILCMIRKFYVT